MTVTVTYCQANMETKYPGYQDMTPAEKLKCQIDNSIKCPTSANSLIPLICLSIAIIGGIFLIKITKK